MIKYERFTYRGWDVELYQHPVHPVDTRWGVNFIRQGDAELPGSYGRMQPSLQRAVVDAKMAINAYISGHPIEPRRHHRKLRRSNPLAMNTPEKIAIGVGVLGAVAAAIYYSTRPAAASTTPPPATVPPLVLPPITTPPTTTPPVTTPAAGVLLQPGTQTVTIPSTGISIYLPSGAKWTSGMATTLIGTSKPFPLAPPQSGTHGTLKFSAGWTDSSGSPRMTDLTLNW